MSSPPFSRAFRQSGCHSRTKAFTALAVANCNLMAQWAFIERFKSRHAARSQSIGQIDSSHGFGVAVPVGSALGETSGVGVGEVFLQFPRHACMSRWH